MSAIQRPLRSAWWFTAPLASMLFVFIGCITLIAGAQDQSSKSSQEEDEPENWATQYIADNPLAGRATIGLDDLRSYLDDPELGPIVLAAEFDRVSGATEDEKFEFLVSQLRHPNFQIRAWAGVKLQERGELKTAVERLLGELIRKGEPEQQQAALLVLAESGLALPTDTQDLLPRLIELLDSDDPSIANAAETVLKNTGAAAVPELMIALENPAIARQAAVVLGGILQEPAPEVILAPRSSQAGVETIAKARRDRQTGGASVREFSDTRPEVQRVYFGTNRALEPGATPPWKSYFWPATVSLLSLAWMAHLVSYLFLNRTTSPGHRLKFWQLLVTVVAAGLIAYGAVEINRQFREQLTKREGPRFAGTRSENREVYYGYCDVSIPPSHIEGVVEQPLFGPADEQRHVVLKRVNLLAENAFFQELRRQLEPYRASKDCFVFIHGYNVSFDSAAMRTAQMLHDLEFEGLGIFYSWPSRASLPHYFSDRHEIAYSHRLIRQFLIDVAQRTGADRVHVIAHSMGADAVCQALLDIDESEVEFSQIILAAPDIDRELFLEDIVPRLKGKSQRTSLYCSRNDVALYASYHFNGFPRAGDSNFGPLVAEGLDTIDASEIDTELLGHSYYASGVPLLRDFAQLMTENLEPPRRRLLPEEDEAGQVYWVLPQQSREESVDSPTAEPGIVESPVEEPD